MIKHQDIAIDLFYEGYNCAQATFMAFEHLVDCNPDEMARIASSFGGGMGKMGEVCGAVTGAFMAVGAILGYDDPKNKELKEKHYEVIQEIADKFKAEKGSILCRDLLQFNEESPGKATRKPKKACEHYVSYATKLADEALSKHSIT